MNDMRERVQQGAIGRQAAYSRSNNLRAQNRSVRRIADVAKVKTLPSTTPPAKAAPPVQNKQPAPASPQKITRRDKKLTIKCLTRSAKILYALENASTPKTAPKKQRKQSKFKPKVSKQFLLRLAAGLLVIFAVYAVIDTLILNHNIRKEKDDTAAAISSDDPNSRRAAEGKDEKTISPDAISKYKVAAELPRVISIEKIGVKARVLQMGVNDDGSMQAPINVFDTGWYTGSVRPGQKGASVIVGHVSGPTKNGIFEKLHTLKKGDMVAVENGAGKVFSYQVESTETVKLDQVDMDKFMRPVSGAEEGLNLMTCSGRWINGGETMDHRLMVYTKRMQ